MDPTSNVNLNLNHCGRYNNYCQLTCGPILRSGRAITIALALTPQEDWPNEASFADAGSRIQVYIVRAVN